MYAVEASQRPQKSQGLHREVRDPSFRRDVDGLVPLAPGLIEVIEGLYGPLKLTCAFLKFAGAWRPRPTPV